MIAVCVCVCVCFTGDTTDNNIDVAGLDALVEPLSLMTNLTDLSLGSKCNRTHLHSIASDWRERDRVCLYIHMYMTYLFKPPNPNPPGNVVTEEGACKLANILLQVRQLTRLSLRGMCLCLCLCLCWPRRGPIMAQRRQALSIYQQCRPPPANRTRPPLA